MSGTTKLRSALALSHHEPTGMVRLFAQSRKIRGAVFACRLRFGGVNAQTSRWSCVDTPRWQSPLVVPAPVLRSSVRQTHRFFYRRLRADMPSARRCSAPTIGPQRAQIEPRHSQADTTLRTSSGRSNSRCGFSRRATRPHRGEALHGRGYFRCRHRRQHVRG